MVLFGLLSGVALGDETLRLRPWPFDPTSLSEPLKVPAAPTLVRPSISGRPKITVRRAMDLEPLRQSVLHTIAELTAYGGHRNRIKVIAVERGQVPLMDVASAVGDEGMLCDGVACRLAMPLFVASGAGLVIEGMDVRMQAETGTFIASQGLMSIRGSSIRAVDRSGPAVYRSAERFRPFIMAGEGSFTEVEDSELRDLGFAGSSAYGLTLTRFNRQDPDLPPPSGVIMNSRVIGLYYGLYTHGAEDLFVLNNRFEKQIQYGIDPHDYSRRLLIAGNIVSDTAKSHGIVLSRGVQDVWIIGNRSLRNAGNGITIDRGSDAVVIQGNRSVANGGDGVAIYESRETYLLDNEIVANGRSGVRVRNGACVTVIGNELLGNADHGLTLYARRPAVGVGRSADERGLETSAVLAANAFGDQGKADLRVRDVDRLVLAGNQIGANQDRISLDMSHPWQRSVEEARKRSSSFAIIASERPPCPVSLPKPFWLPAPGQR